MKHIIGTVLFAGILSMVTGCSDSNTDCSDKDKNHEHLNQPPTNIAIDCLPYLPGFIHTYRDCIEQDEVYFVKGEVTAEGNYGINIKIMEDLKGNFKDEPSITLWSHWEFGVSTQGYKAKDVLLILMSRIDDTDNSWGGERREDYCTIACSTSILLFSEGNVTGRITTNGEEITVPWKDLQERLPSTCQSEMDFAENWNANINREDIYFIKGTVVQEPFSNGIKINPVKDLKGNFPDSPVIGVWGKGDLSNCIDILCTYHRDTASIPTDTLYMLLKPVASEDIPCSNRKAGDYSTIECAHSVVPVDMNDCKLVAFKGENGEWMTVEEFENKFGINPDR